MSKNNPEQHSKPTLRSLQELECPPELYERVWSNSMDQMESARAGQEQPIEGRIRPSLWRSMIVTAVSAASLLLILAVASSFSPSLAHALSRLPVVGGLLSVMDHLGVRTTDEQGLLAEPEASDSHDGITLRVPQVAYDGKVLLFTVQRESHTSGTNEGDGQLSTDTSAVDSHFGASDFESTIENYRWQINGQVPERTGLARSVSPDPNVVAFKGHNYTRADQHLPPMPDEFELTVMIELKGIEKPYLLQFPVKNTMSYYEDTPNIVKETPEVTLILQQIQYTPLSTSYNMLLQHNTPESRLKYHGMMVELWDDQGRQLDWISGFGDFNDNGQMSQNFEFLYDRFQDPPAYLVLKPFIPVMQQPGASSGPYALDANGQVQKVYLKELEMVVPVDQSRLQRLYNSNQTTLSSK